jgi:hypothetical protein
VIHVRKTTLAIDDDKIAQAREILGTTGITAAERA